MDRQTRLKILPSPSTSLAGGNENYSNMMYHNSMIFFHCVLSSPDVIVTKTVILEKFVSRRPMIHMGFVRSVVMFVVVVHKNLFYGESPNF